MGKLSDILRNAGNAGDIADAWNTTTAAGDDDILPRGEYVADITKGEAIESRSNRTPGYRLTFEVADGDHKGRRFWHECWFTPKAMSRTKRDLGRLGVTSLEQLERPLPGVFRCRVKLNVRRDDDGNESNRVRTFDVIDFRKPTPDPFAPGDIGKADNGEHDGAPEPQTDAAGGASRPPTVNDVLNDAAEGDRDDQDGDDVESDLF